MPLTEIEYKDLGRSCWAQHWSTECETQRSIQVKIQSETQSLSLQPKAISYSSMEPPSSHKRGWHHGNGPHGKEKKQVVQGKKGQEVKNWTRWGERKKKWGKGHSLSFILQERHKVILDLPFFFFRQVCVIWEPNRNTEHYDLYHRGQLATARKRQKEREIIYYIAPKYLMELGGEKLRSLK